MASLALYKGKGDAFNGAIRWWTDSKYSHCEILLDDGFAYSASIKDKGVRRKFIPLNAESWDIIYLPWVKDNDVRELYKLTENHKYDFISLLFSQVINKKTGDNKMEFCSEWCAMACGLPNPEMYSPGELGDLCLELARIYMAKGK